MIGQTISRYRIVSKLGAGGMGEVYLAEDTELGREVALKILPRGKADDPERLERFRREARAVAALNHPNIVTIFNVEEANGRRVLVMEHVEGRSLDRHISAQGLPLTTVFDIAIPIAEALAAAHDKGITHRDLKPSNVMVADTESSGVQVKVLDFGLAKLAADAAAGVPGGEIATQAATATAALTGEGTVMGTAPYMSPEQLQGKPVDHRTDIFSFGILLYEMVVGQRPFQGETGLELASSILKDAPSSVIDVRDDVPRHLGRIIQHCLEKDPERRFQSAKDIRNELEELRQEIDSGALEMSGSQQVPVAPATEAKSGSFRLVAGAAVILAVAALAAIWWQRGASDPRADAVPTTTGQPTVAVLPFRNMGADASLDYLRLAVPDEITTSLSRAPGLAIRPFSMTSSLQDETTDPLSVGHDLGVANVITGQYFQEGDQLSLTLEAIDVERNVVVWRENVVAGTQALISLRAQVADTVERDLLPILGGDQSGLSRGTQPTSEEAYDLYLRSLPATSDPAPNAEALELLERAVELDPNYAPAWAELAARYYFVGNYGSGSEEDYDRSVAAAERALELDPDLVDAAVRLIVVAVERGRLVEAYQAAERILLQRPDVARAHFARSYVLRYGGALDRALLDCDAALALDPRNPLLRSCGIANSTAGRYDRAVQFLLLDPTSGLALDNMVVLRLRQRRPQEALEAMRVALANIWQVLGPCLEGEELPADGIRTVVDGTLPRHDSEQQYWAGSLLAYCGAHAAGLELLRAGIERGYCSFPFMDTDPLLESLRADSTLVAEYVEVRAAGRECHEAFLARIDG